MLPLRDSDIQNASSLENFFPMHDHKPFQQEVMEAVEQEGKGVLCVRDGGMVLMNFLHTREWRHHFG